MEENDFLKKMENLKKPEVRVEVSRRQIKLAIMSGKKSAAWGIWFLAIPIFFLACVAIKELFHWDWGVSDNFLEWMGRISKQSSMGWIMPVTFVLLPALGAIANLLAIMHFIYDKIAKELIITIKIKWLNIILAIISIVIIGFVFVYGIAETAAERAIHRLEKAEERRIK